MVQNISSTSRKRQKATVFADIQTFIPNNISIRDGRFIQISVLWMPIEVKNKIIDNLDEILNPYLFRDQILQETNKLTPIEKFLLYYDPLTAVMKEK